MIRIGFSRWFVIADKIPLNNGKVNYFLGLVPLAKKYKVSYQKPYGLHYLYDEKEV